MTLQSRSTETVLVTGGAGFIGCHVARRLALAGFRVVVLDDLSGGFVENVPAGVEFTEGSILNQPLLQELFEKNKFRYVFHLAAYAAEGLSPFIRRFNYENNLIGSINLINLSVKYEVRRFVFTSSIAVYGKNQLPMSESMHPVPEDPYGISKLAVEMDLRCAHDLFGLPYTIFRPHNVFGEGQNIGDRYRNVIGIFMNQVMQDKALTIFGDGKQTRAFSYIDDVAIPIVACIGKTETEQQIFNVGADTPYSVNQLAEAVFVAMGKQSSIVHLESRNEVTHAYADHSKIKRYFPELNSSVPLAAGLKQMADWARIHGPRKTQIFANIEIFKQLPQSWAAEISSN